MKRRPTGGTSVLSVLASPRCLYSRPIHRLSPACRTPVYPHFLKQLNLHHLSIRFASTSRTAAEDSRSIVTRLKNLLLGTAIGLSLILGYVYITDTRASVHLLTPHALRWVYDDAEEAHEAGNRWLKLLYAFGLHPRERGNLDGNGDLAVEVFGHTLSNPIGTSAGIDKHAEIPDPLFAIGPAVIEIGGTTPYPQDGNPKPRVFRLPSQKALINCYGFNSEGADNVAMRLRQRVREYAFAMGLGIDEEAERMVLDGEAGVPPGSLMKGRLMAVQVAKNKVTPDEDIEAVKADYVYCVEALARYADIIVVNVSSPNTPGLRGLQRVEPLTNILTGVVAAARNANRKSKPSVMVKVSPDEDSEAQVRGICDAVWQSGVDGVIVGNTTTRRPDPFPEGYTLPQREAIALLQQGGYSGPQLFKRTVALTARYRRILDEGLYSAPDTKSPPPPPSPPNAQSTPQNPIIESPPDPHSADPLSSQIEAAVARDIANLKPDTPSEAASSKDQPLIRLPERNNPLSDASSSSSDPPAFSASTHINQLPSPSSSPSQSPSPQPSPTQADLPPTPYPTPPPERKLIFATGGITTGAQALEVLAAGASVAQIYTALVYGGVGTVGRIKGELREELQRRRSGGDGE